MYAVLKALDLQHVQRIILVGDPNQLPPIGAGRPFADLVGTLRQGKSSEDAEIKNRAAAFVELRTKVRTVKGQESDALRLAALFASGEATVDADRILNDLETGAELNDISICYWRTVDDLKKVLIGQLRLHLNLSGRTALGDLTDRWDLGTMGQYQSLQCNDPPSQRGRS